MIGYRNSLGMLFLGTAVNLVLTILCAYPLSRRDLWGKSGIMLYVTFPMFFSGGMIPTYLLVSKTLHLTNSWWAVILVGGIATYNMIIMRTFFSGSIPYELQEAAQIDGCTPFGILFRIILPLSIPVICVIGLYYGVFLWNSYFQSLIYLTDKNKWPLQLFLRQILVANDRRRRRRVCGRNGTPRHARGDDQVRHRRARVGAHADHLPVRAEILRKGRHDRLGQGLIANGFLERLDRF